MNKYDVEGFLNRRIQFLQNLKSKIEHEDDYFAKGVHLSIRYEINFLLSIQKNISTLPHVFAITAERIDYLKQTKDRIERNLSEGLQFDQGLTFATQEELDFMLTFRACLIRNEMNAQIH